MNLRTPKRRVPYPIKNGQCFAYVQTITTEGTPTWQQDIGIPRVGTNAPCLLHTAQALKYVLNKRLTLYFGAKSVNHTRSDIAYGGRAPRW